MGVSLSDLHCVDEAIDAFRRSLYFRPDAIDTHKNLGIALLINGDFEQGWLEYEWRWKGDGPPKPKVEGTRWDGSPLEGRKLLMCAEQGLGDTIQFVRYAQLAQQQGADVIVQYQKPLKSILKSCSFVDELVADDEPIPEFDMYSSLLSLPYGFRTTVKNLPPDVPYLAASPELVDRWRDFLADSEGFRVGIAWQGSKAYAGDAHRSIPLSMFEPLAHVKEVRLISLQRGEELE